MQEVEAEKAVAEAEEANVSKEKEIVQQHRSAALALQTEAQQEFEEALPALEAALCKP